MQYDKEIKKTIEEINQRIQELQSKVDELKNGNNKCARWRAKEGEKYWTLDNCYGFPAEFEERNSLVNSFKYQTGNYFKTKQEAEKYRQHLIITQKLKDIALRLNNGREIDWKTKDMKYFIKIGNNTILEQSWNYYTKYQGSIHCLSDKFLETAIKEIGEQELIDYIKEG